MFQGALAEPGRCLLGCRHRGRRQRRRAAGPAQLPRVLLRRVLRDPDGNRIEAVCHHPVEVMRTGRPSRTALGAASTAPCISRRKAASSSPIPMRCTSSTTDARRAAGVCRVIPRNERCACSSPRAAAFRRKRWRLHRARYRQVVILGAGTRHVFAAELPRRCNRLRSRLSRNAGLEARTALAGAASRCHRR